MSWFKNEKVLVPIDLSEPGYDAVDWVLARIEDKAQLTVLHVIEPVHTLGGPVIAEVDCAAERSRFAREHVKLHYKELDNDIDFVLRDGFAAVEIARFVRENGVGLVVMPSHARGGVSRFLLGSVTDKVVRDAKCPVLVLHRDHNGLLDVHATENTDMENRYA